MFSNKQLKDMIQSSTAGTDVKELLMKAVVSASCIKLTDYFYHILTDYCTAYVDVLDAGLSHVDLCTTLSLLDRVKNKLPLTSSTVCVIDPVDMITYNHAYEYAEPHLYDDIANLLYMHNGNDGVDMTDQVIGVVRHVVDLIESHYVYQSEDITPIKMVIACQKDNLLVGLN